MTKKGVLTSLIKSQLSILWSNVPMGVNMKYVMTSVNCEKLVDCEKTGIILWSVRINHI